MSYTSQQVLKYIKKIHKKGFSLDSAITQFPQWELKNVDINSLKINDDGLLDDPYNRVIDINFDHVDDLTKHDILSHAVVVDDQGWILDGNHRVAKAKELGMTEIPAFAPASELIESAEPSEYVYHAGYMPYGLDSVLRRGLLPSKDGYAGPGVYFAYDPDGGYYHVSQEDATMFRVKWSNLVAKFGKYPENPDGIQRDDDEIIVPGAVPANMLEVEYFPGEWWPVDTAVAHSAGPVDEAVIDNRAGAGAVPFNADVDYFGLRVKMKPSTFLKLAAPLGDKDNSKMEEYIRNGGAIGAPFLDITIPPEWDEGNFSKNAKIQGHEGRHRMLAVQAVEGNAPIEVHLFPKYYRSRDITSEFKEKINSGLYAEKTTNLIHGPLFGGVIDEATTSSAEMRAWFAQQEPAKPKVNKTINLNNADLPPHIKMILWKVQNKKQISRNEYGELKMWNDRRQAFGEEDTGVLQVKLDSKARAKAWIEKVYAKYPGTWQNNHVMTWGEGDDQQLAMFELIPSMSKKDAVEVKWFQAYPLRQGVGSRAMTELKAMAKEDNISLTLFPWQHGQVSQAKLTKFYKGQGFKPTVKGAKNMIWTPGSLDEAFDQPYPITWEEGDYDSQDALARLPDGHNLSINFNLESGGPEGMDEEWHVEFWRNNSLEVTGEGDAYRIFATVMVAIQEFIEKENPERISFSASKEVEPGQNSQSRAKLYDRLVQRYARAWGYKSTRADRGDVVVYELVRLKRSTRESVNEGGWASAATQNTTITPHVIDEAIVILNQFASEYNAWQTEQGYDLEIKMGKPVGSGTYYKRDLEHDPKREYGDVDVVCYIHSAEGISAARRTSEYSQAVKEFTESNQKYSTQNGANVIMDTSAGPIQVDLIYTYNEHANWARALAPEYRVKGVISASLLSSLAETLNMSFGIQGVQVKTRAGRPVSFRQSKDTELQTVSTNPENWAGDMYSYYYQLQNGTKPEIPANLAVHSGLKDEQRLSDIVLAFKALARDLSVNGLLGIGALDYIPDEITMMKMIAQVYSKKLDAVITSSKFDKASTPAAVEKADKTKLMLAKYRNEITKLLLN